MTRSVLMFNSHNFKLRVSNPRTIAYIHFNMLFESSNLPGGWDDFSRLNFWKLTEKESSAHDSNTLSTNSKRILREETGQRILHTRIAGVGRWIRVVFRGSLDMFRFLRTTSCVCNFSSEHWDGWGANKNTPEINTSEIIVDFQWHFPMDFQRHFPT